MNAGSITAEISRVRDRLSRLEAERIALQGELEALERQLDAVEQTRTEQVTLEGAAVVNSSSSQEKINLFRSLFAGRSDVFPLRWENRKLVDRATHPPASMSG
ncbi:TOTE conflict system archaeo-eukaryotic primase domain-containing protein [Paracoccus versutus]